MFYITELRQYCLSKAGCTESTPFDIETLVFKVGNKIFLITNIEHFEEISLKCDPELAQNLRAQYPDAVRAGYHLNKKHWNTINLRGGMPLPEVLGWIDHSYSLVFSSLKKVEQQAILTAENQA